MKNGFVVTWNNEYCIKTAQINKIRDKTWKIMYLQLSNKTFSPFLYSLVKTEAKVWENSRADQWKFKTQSRFFTCSTILTNFAEVWQVWTDNRRPLAPPSSRSTRFHESALIQGDSLSKRWVRQRVCWKSNRTWNLVPVLGPNKLYCSIQCQHNF